MHDLGHPRHLIPQPGFTSDTKALEASALWELLCLVGAVLDSFDRYSTVLFAEDTAACTFRKETAIRTRLG